MFKVLKPYTIIPQNLYVHRAADRQVKHIITDMGRPGYVLVARQMGKTNLLINAKRELETDNDVFVYIDLSNTFDSSRGCFENIINTALETNEDKFKDVIDDLHKRRSELRELPPHKQHTNELKILLKAIPGKLVIILDEIDVLTRTQYSDQIFSQIRSIYFSRINYAELSRLTYLLSGVVEPTEIIKDTKISPFNIGQKIFLNDFTEVEFELFLEQAGLDKMEDELKERVYYWTSGNPRMTWDVCSEVENFSKESKVTLAGIDKIVKELYLKTFDKPPIDTIRELTKNDREIRNAIVEIESNKGKEISDKLKSKLYLSGITNYEDDSVRLKNNILRESLTLSWIQSIEEEERGLVWIADDLFDQKKYAESLATYKRYLHNADFPEEKMAICYYQMGYAAFLASDFREAIDYLEKSDLIREESETLFITICNLKGTAYFYLNEFDASMKHFKTAIEQSKKDELYAKALLNYGSALIKSDVGQYREEATKIFEDIINEVSLDKDKIKEPFLNELKSIAYYNIALLIERTEADRAKEFLRMAIQHSTNKTKPLMILTLFHHEKTSQKKVSLLNSIVDIIIDNTLVPKQKNPENPLDFTSEQLNEAIVYSYLYDRDNAFKKLGKHKNLTEYLINLPNLMFEVAMNAAVSKRKDDTIAILRELNAGQYEIDRQTRYLTTKYLAYFVDNKQELEVALDYLELFSVNRVTKIDYMDFEIVSNVIFIFTERNEVQKALELIRTIESVKSEVDKSLLINYLVIYYVEFHILKLMHKNQLAQMKAQSILDLCKDDELNSYKSNLLGGTGLETIRQNVENYLHPQRHIKMPITAPMSFGRNEIIKVRYKDARIVTAKYKKVEHDIKTGKCEILEDDI